MAQSENIINRWSLVAFAKAKGPKMQVGKFINGDTSEEFTSCIFTNDKEEKTFVAFSKNMGVLTPTEIASKKDSLQVVELGSGHFTLCNSNWQEVDLGL